MRRPTPPFATLLVIACALAGCPKKQSDAERAAEQRDAAHARLEKSLVLVPYRGLKIALRSKGEQTVPEALAPLTALAAPDRDVRELVAALYRGRKALEGLDEDRFQPLWQAFFGAPPLFPGYDAKTEHLLLALVWLSLDSAAPPPAGLGEDLVFYELERAPPAAGWPWELRSLSHLSRGVAYARAELHYAAEEELTHYLADLEAVSPAERAATATRVKRSPDELLQSARALGYFARAWNRTALGRRDTANRDVELGLMALKKIGVDNELTWWGWALVYQRTSRYPEAAGELAKLANSPFLDDDGRQEVRACADQMKQQGADPGLFAKQRSLLLISRALIARAGGVERLLEGLLGDARGQALWARLAWMDRARHALAAPIEGAGKAADQAKQGGRRALDFVKDKVAR